MNVRSIFKFLYFEFENVHFSTAQPGNSDNSICILLQRLFTALARKQSGHKWRDNSWDRAIALSRRFFVTHPSTTTYSNPVISSTFFAILHGTGPVGVLDAAINSSATEFVGSSFSTLYINQEKRLALSSTARPHTQCFRSAYRGCNFKNFHVAYHLNCLQISQYARGAAITSFAEFYIRMAIEAQFRGDNNWTNVIQSKPQFTWR